MTKFILISFILLTLFLIENLAFDVENYANFIEERSRDDKFVEEYTKWSLKLLSQPGYLYGIPHGKSPCSLNKSDDNNNISISVHTLRPSDITCIGAMGDSFTAGLASHGITPTDLLFEDRGISWSIGGDYTYSQISTIPNALRQNNQTLKGFSTKGYMVPNHRKHPTTNQLNVAKSDARSIDMSSQADSLIYLLQLQNKSICDLKNDWKMITIFIGTNDLCNFCEDINGTDFTPEQYVTNIRLALDTLYNASIPRMLINLVLPADIRGYKEYNNDTYVCQTLLKKLCPCAAFPTVEQTKILDDYIPRYQELLRNLIDSGRYEKRDDFTVVIQPFMSKNQLPYKDNNTIDFSYLSPDCFHFSGKGHSQAAISLWNNMFEPVGIKQETWFLNETLKCPTQKYPYIFTSKNSAQALNELKPKTIVQSTSTISNTNITTIVNTTLPISNTNITTVVNTTLPINNNFNTTDYYTYNSSSIININKTIRHGHKNRNNTKKFKSDSNMSKMKLITITGFSLIIILILIAGIIRRKQPTVTCLSQTEDGKFHRLDEESEEDLDVYVKPTQNSDYSDTKITTSHGSRVRLD